MRVCYICKIAGEEESFPLSHGKRENRCKKCKSKANKDYYNKLKTDPIRLDKYREGARKAKYKSNRTIEGRYGNLIKQAKNRNIEVKLTLEEYSYIIKDLKCHYCKKELHATGSGLDRKDNNRGYEKNNVVACCKHCNERKSNWLTYDEYIKIIEFLEISRGTRNINLKNRT